MHIDKKLNKWRAIKMVIGVLKFLTKKFKLFVYVNSTGWSEIWNKIHEL